MPAAAASQHSHMNPALPQSSPGVPVGQNLPYISGRQLGSAADMQQQQQQRAAEEKVSAYLNGRATPMPGQFP